MRLTDVLIVENQPNLRNNKRRNQNRRLRRRRSKFRYYSHLNSVRFKRKTDDLCVDITEIRLSDMELSRDVADWRKQEEMVYWKSRALSLEFENKVLRQHLRNVYAKQTEDYVNSLECEKVQKSIETNDLANKRREEMQRMYGDKASKIMGMETAVQLNYDLHLEDAGKIPHWPHTPLNIRFDD